MIFFDILKHKYKFILLVGFVLFLFAIPQFVLNSSFSNMISSLFKNPEFLIDGYLNENGINSYNASIVIYSCAHFITYFIFFIGLGGAIRVIRLLSFNEGILFWEDFWIGIKQNFKQFSLLSLILSFGLCLFNLARIVSNVVIKGIIYGLTFGLFIPFISMGVIYSSIYSIKGRKMIINSFALYVKNFFFLLFIPLFALLYLAIDFIPLLLISYLIKIIFIIFLLPILILCIYLPTLNIFDKLINEISHKELLNKGLYIKDNKND